MNETTRKAANEVSRVLLEKYQPVGEEPGMLTYIPRAGVEEIAEELTDFIAEVLQGWLDAGSERDVTYEELGPAIQDHVKGWSLPTHVKEEVE